MDRGCKVISVLQLGIPLLRLLFHFLCCIPDSHPAQWQNKSPNRPRISPQVDPVTALGLAVLPPLLGPDRLFLGDALPLRPRLLRVLDRAGHVARLCPQRQPRLLVGVTQGHDLGQRVVGDVEGAQLGLDARERLRRAAAVSLVEGDYALKLLSI